MPSLRVQNCVFDFDKLNGSHKFKTIAICFIALSLHCTRSAFRRQRYIIMLLYLNTIYLEKKGIWKKIDLTCSTLTSSTTGVYATVILKLYRYYSLQHIIVIYFKSYRDIYVNNKISQRFMHASTKVYIRILQLSKYSIRILRLSCCWRKMFR